MKVLVKNIAVGILVGIYLNFAFTDQDASINQKNNSTSTDCTFHFEQDSKTQSSKSQPKIVAKKPKPTVIKIKILTVVSYPLSKLLSFEQLSYYKSIDQNRLKSNISYVRYLPRDPPKA